MLHKELIDPAILIVPGIFILKAVTFGWIHHHLKVLVACLNQSLDVLYRILKAYVVVNESV